MDNVGRLLVSGTKRISFIPLPDNTRPSHFLWENKFLFMSHYGATWRVGRTPALNEPAHPADTG